MSFEITDDDNSLSDYVDKPMAKDMEDYFGSKASELSKSIGAAYWSRRQEIC